jgi:hypothetical protein
MTAATDRGKVRAAGFG